MITTKDLQIINDALAQYQALILEEVPGNLARDLHEARYGEPEKTILATRNRVYKLLLKRERTCS